MTLEDERGSRSHLLPVPLRSPEQRTSEPMLDRNVLRAQAV